MNTEHKAIINKIKKLISEKKQEKVIRLDNILNKLFDCQTTDEMIECSRKLKQVMECYPLTEIRGIAEYELIQGGSISRGWHSYPIYSSVVAYRTPCKEFISLRNYLKKYANYKLQLGTFYYYHLFGKRNDKYIRGSNLLTYDPDCCKKILNWLRDNKATRYAISIEGQHSLERDENAYRAETEWYGNEWNSMKITLKSKRTDKSVKSQTFTLF